MIVCRVTEKLFLTHTMIWNEYHIYFLRVNSYCVYFFLSHLTHPLDFYCWLLTCHSFVVSSLIVFTSHNRGPTYQKCPIPFGDNIPQICFLAYRLNGETVIISEHKAIISLLLYIQAISFQI